MPRFIACYNAYLNFIIPKNINIYLLDQDDPKNDGKNVGSWWVKWGTFHYIDKDGKQNSIHPMCDGDDVDWKYPSGKIEIDDDYEDKEEEEQEEKAEEPPKIEAPFVMGDPDEDLVNFMHDGAELFMGVKTGAIYINKPDGDIRIGTAGQGKFRDVKIPVM